ncbi:MAG: VWA domain-containing protein [Eubacterium sp.]|nr:VWA domain-containing protein [Eubacterium sp.]
MIVSQTDEEILYENAPGEGRKGLHLDKKIFPLGGGAYTVMLEAYADSSVSDYEKPADYYLVLDVSTRMSYFEYPDSPDGKRFGALKKAASEFVDMAAARNSSADAEEQSRIAIVQFSDAEHSGVVCGLTPLTTEGAQQLHASIDSLACSHLTRTDLGMLYTEQLIAAQANERDKIVILVTDGQPNDQDGFQPSTANAALACAARLKTAGVRIYAVSIEEHAKVNAGGALPEYEKDPADGTESNFLYMWNEVSYEGGPAVNTTIENACAMTDRFMHLISSNNPRAMSMDLADGTDPDAAGRTIAEDGTGYYLTAKDMSSLSRIFSQLVSNRTNYDPCLTVNSQVRDIVAKDFVVKEGGKIRTLSASRLESGGTPDDNNESSGGSGGDDAKTKTAAEWGAYKEEELKVVPSTDSVKVSGFDFREKKLAILFDIVRKPDSTSQGWVPTNAEISGVYENDSTEEALAYFPIPKVNLKSTDPIDSSTEPAPDPVKPSEEQKQPEEQKTPEQKQPEKAEAQTPVVVNTVLKPAQPVFEVHTSTNTPVTISGNSIQIQGGDNNSETVVSTVSGNPAGTASGAIPGGTPAGAAGNAAGSAGSAPEAGKADRPLPVTADESDNGMWFLILASVCCLIPAILYSILQSVPARESR